MQGTFVDFGRPLRASDEQSGVAQVAHRHANRVDKIVMLPFRELRRLIYDGVCP